MPSDLTSPPPNLEPRGWTTIVPTVGWLLTTWPRETLKLGAIGATPVNPPATVWDKNISSPSEKSEVSNPLTKP